MGEGLFRDIPEEHHMFYITRDYDLVELTECEMTAFFINDVQKELIKTALMEYVPTLEQRSISGKTIEQRLETRSKITKQIEEIKNIIKMLNE